MEVINARVNITTQTAKTEYAYSSMDMSGTKEKPTAARIDNKLIPSNHLPLYAFTEYQRTGSSIVFFTLKPYNPFGGIFPMIMGIDNTPSKTPLKINRYMSIVIFIHPCNSKYYHFHGIRYFENISQVKIRNILPGRQNYNSGIIFVPEI